MGGMSEGVLLGDAVIVDLSAKSGHKLNVDLTFECTANSVMIEEGNVCSLVSDSDGKCLIIRFSSSTNKIDIIKNFGADGESEQSN